MKLKKIFASLLSLGLILSPLSVCAQENTAVAQSEDGTQTYANFDLAWSAAENGEKIVLLQDWDLTDRIYVAENLSISIELNGHTINRQLGGNVQNDGEVFYLSENATLTLTGNNQKDTQFKFKGYDGSNDLIDITYNTGGLVTGGASSNGAGGIHMKKSSKLYLENVAVAGNCGASIFTHDGGAINMNEDDCEVHMTNSSLCFNDAAYGGGICVSGENEIIEMNASSICNNYSTVNGGGIFSDEDATYVVLNNGSSIKNNRALEYGGGIYFENPYCQVRSSDTASEISGNHAKCGGGIHFSSSSRGDTHIIENVTFDSNLADSSGGAIYNKLDDLTIKNCTFTKNRAEKSNGGAIYVAGKGLKIDSCTVQKNTSKSDGAGMYVSVHCSISMSGMMYVENNTRLDNTKDDVYLSGETTISGTPDSGSRVGINSLHDGKVCINQTVDNGVFFVDDSDSYYLGYNDGKLYMISGSLLGSIFGNANLGIAVVVMAGIAVVGIVILIISKRKNHVEA